MESSRWVSPTYFYPGSGEKVESWGVGAPLPSLTPHEEVLQDGLFVELGLRRKSKTLNMYENQFSSFQFSCSVVSDSL